MLRFVSLMLLGSAACSAQLVDRSKPVEPQTPRQALIEILKSKDGSAFERHLPEMAKKKLREFSSGQQSGLAAISPRPYGRFGFAGENVEVFEAGPILARLGEATTDENFEIVIENEDFRGDETDFEFAFHAYKKGEEVTSWYMPRLMVNMKQEADVWRIAEVAFSVRLRFSDPEFLEGVAKELRQNRNRMALVNLQSIVAAQTTYARKYPQAGYACSLGSLGSGVPGKEPAKRVQGSTQAMLIEDTLATGRNDGYLYAISNCMGRPADSYAVTAIPEKPGPGAYAYCSNQSGSVRFAADGKAETCLDSGKPLE